MQCDYFDAGVCRSCRLLGTAYGDQLAAKQARCEATLRGVAPDLHWEEPRPSRESGFRNRAKLVVGGSPSAPTLGILDARGAGVDLRECALHEPAIVAALPHLADLIAELRLLPYDVPRRRGELKYLLVAGSPAGQLMLRFVLRSTTQLPRIREALPRLQRRLPGLAVVSVNLHPEHKAVLEGDTELLLTDEPELRMPLGEVTLRLRPRSFFQTNSEMAISLYGQARDWIDRADPATVLDLYCGVGGFALHALAPGRLVTGVELSADAIEAARGAEAELQAARPQLGPATFVAGDATAYAQLSTPPDLVVVNPPRRGLDAGLTDWLDRSSVRHVLYSSCHVDTLARDLARMPSFAARTARLFDMFPHTEHHEVLVLLERRS